MVTRMRLELLRGDPSRAKALRPGYAAGAYRLPSSGLSRLLAHDLKTPLASIAMNLDFVIAELAMHGGDAVGPAIEDCRQANARAIRIVSDMADAARLAAGDYHPTLDDVRPGALVEKVVCAATCEAASRAIKIVVTTDSTRVTGDADLLSRVIERLLERALRQARTGSRVDVQQKDRALSIRALAGPGDPDLTAPSLAIYFAEAAMAALGGGVWVESPEADVLVCRLMFPG
jgi:K+-sensing histidine kinase KdpD